MSARSPRLGHFVVNSDPAVRRPQLPTGRDLSVLERDYPGVTRTLTLLWGHPELNQFLARVAAGLDPRLLHLEPAAMAEIMLLGEVHRSICPQPERTGAELHPIGRAVSAWRPVVQRG